MLPILHIFCKLLILCKNVQLHCAWCHCSHLCCHPWQVSSVLKPQIFPFLIMFEIWVPSLVHNQKSFRFPMGSHQVPNVLPRFPMCSPRVFPIAPCCNPICFAQSPPHILFHMNLLGVPQKFNEFKISTPLFNELKQICFNYCSIVQYVQLLGNTLGT
jgi:hypothetical protein